MTNGPIYVADDNDRDRIEDAAELRDWLSRITLLRRRVPRCRLAGYVVAGVCKVPTPSYGTSGTRHREVR